VKKEVSVSVETCDSPRAEIWRNKLALAGFNRGSAPTKKLKVAPSAQRTGHARFLQRGYLSFSERKIRLDFSQSIAGD
jgi:hypothetical protein